MIHDYLGSSAVSPPKTPSGWPTSRSSGRSMTSCSTCTRALHTSATRSRQLQRTHGCSNCTSYRESASRSTWSWYGSSTCPPLTTHTCDQPGAGTAVPPAHHLRGMLYVLAHSRSLMYTDDLLFIGMALSPAGGLFAAAAALRCVPHAEGRSEGYPQGAESCRLGSPSSFTLTAPSCLHHTDSFILTAPH